MQLAKQASSAPLRAAPLATAASRAASPVPAQVKNPPLPETIAQFEAALACAEEALRMDGRSVEALHNRGLALQELDQLDQARDAFTRALAIDPDDPETLAGAADLYINRLLPSAELSEIGVEYAHRGSQRLRRGGDKTADLGAGKKQGPSKDRGDRGLLARLLLLEAQGLNDLGRPREALARLEAAIAASDTVQARYERAMALLDLCRFTEARRGFTEVIEREPGDAWAHYGLGLSLEMMGQQTAADKELEAAQKLAPREFPELLPVSRDQFRALVDKEVAGLSPAQRDDLSHVSLETADLPELSDLTAEDPPLSPTILGLFRGLPLGESGCVADPAPPGPGPLSASGKAQGKAAPRSKEHRPSGATDGLASPQSPQSPGNHGNPRNHGNPGNHPGNLGDGASPADPTEADPRAIVLYRKNLLRAVRTQEELVEQIRTTLLHELGHLRGEDDAELRARGLE
jgi:tetratricopeptide (TPR) repeat protein